MVVLSLFDGMSCGQIALNECEVKYTKYYASEIDKHAIKVTQHNFPNTIQLGDVKKWRDWNIDWCEIDLLIGGFPCQAFSIAGKQQGINDPRGQLLFDLMDIYKHLKKHNPDIKFMFENVKMKKEHQEYVDNYIGCKSIFINSQLLSAQNRNRQYWTNIEGIELPEDKNILLEDILEPNLNFGEQVVFDDNNEYITYARNGKKIRLNGNLKPPYTIYETRTEFGKQERARLRKLLGRDTTPRNKEHKEYVPLYTNKSNCLLTSKNDLDYVLDCNYRFRTYTTKELSRLQNIPDNYFDGIDITENQIRKMVGNGWTVNVISHIFNKLK